MTIKRKEFKRKFLASAGVSPVWDWVGYVLGAIPFVWLANRYDNWVWLVLAVLQGVAQWAVGWWIIEREMSKESE